MRNKILFGISLTILILCIAGCTTSKYNSSYKQFKESYILATAFVDSDNDPIIALKNMDANLTENELKKMKEALDIMGSEVNSKDDKGVYSNMKDSYDGLEFLLASYNNFDTFFNKYDTSSIEKKTKLYSEIELVSMHRKNMQQGEE